MRCLLVLLAAAGLGCLHPPMQIDQESGESFAEFHRIAVPSFRDSRDQGGAIADALAKALQDRFDNRPVDRTILDQALSEQKVVDDSDADIEKLARVRLRVTLDAVIFGKMNADWNEAKIVMLDGKTGATVFHAKVRPRGGKKAFLSPDDISRELMRAIAGLR